jgi:hypothetical protein
MTAKDSELSDTTADTAALNSHQISVRSLGYNLLPLCKFYKLFS